jgi:hypothetical protein
MRSLFLAPTAFVAVAAIAASQSTAATGDRPEYRFQRPVQNGMGVGSLAELQGKPVLVEFWGTR